MKKKISRILGLGLALVMVLSLTIAMAAPVSADENDWSKFSYPKANGDGDWFRAANITAGPGPMVITIDDTLLVAAAVSGENFLFKSTDDGGTWSKTDYHKDLTGEVAIVDIACSSMDADIYYITDGNHVYWTKNGGGKVETIADASLPAAVKAATENITSVDVAYDGDDEPYVFIGTSTGAGGGHVYYVAQSGYPSQWTDLAIGTTDVLAVGASPDFDTEDEVFAVTSGNATANATVWSNVGSVGDWDLFAELERDETLGVAAFTIGRASRIGFPGEFDTDDAYEFFVGVSATSTNDVGSVYRVTEDVAYRLGDEDADVEADIVSLDLVGDYGYTSLLAGTLAGETDKVLVSTDDGDGWDDADKDPSGSGDAYVVMDEDFDDNGIAWAAVGGIEGAVSLTTDSGAPYNQISLIHTDINTIDNLSFSPKFGSDETLFMVSTDNGSITGEVTNSVWRYVGGNDYEWVRVTDNYTLGAANGIDLVQVSPRFSADEAVFITNRANTDVAMFPSTDAGGDWDELTRHPDELSSWVVIDDETVIAGGGTTPGYVYYTDQHGRRAWDDEKVSDDCGSVMSFSLSPNMAADETVLLGDDEGQVFISEDLGEGWDQVEDDNIGEAGNTFVTFDPGYGDREADGYYTVYAAAGGTIGRCVIDPKDDWEDQDWKDFDDADEPDAMVAATGIIWATDGTLYASDATAANATAGGVWRSLNPTADMDDVEWELTGANMGLDDGVSLGNVRRTTGSNVLWARDLADDDIWTFEDTMMAAMELVSPWSNTGLDDTDEVYFEWAEVEEADSYQLKYTTDETFDTKVTTIDGEDDLYYLAEGLTSGKAYYWKVRVDAPLHSRWSRVWNFTTKLAAVAIPEHWMPENGESDVSISTSLGWTRVSNATSYEIELASNADFTDATQATSTINSWVPGSDLAYSTTYYWRVRALRDTVVISSWRSGVFVTGAKAVAPPKPVEVTPAPPAPQITVTSPPITIPVQPTPSWVWAIIGVGAALVIAVIVLIVRTRRAM